MHLYSALCGSQQRGNFKSKEKQLVQITGEGGSSELKRKILLNYKI